MNFKRNWNLILLLIPLLFLCLNNGCFREAGPAGFTMSQPTSEYNEWMAKVENMSPLEFAEWWNTEELKNWTYDDWTDLLNWDENKHDSPVEIIESKIYNCHRISTVVFMLYNSMFVSLKQPDDVRHEVLIIDYADKFWCFSVSGPITVWELVSVKSFDDEKAIEKELFEKIPFKGIYFRERADR